MTICTYDRIQWFGRVADGVVVLNDIGNIADAQWQWLGQQYPYVNLGPYVIMPNHIHALIGINNPVGTGRDRSAGNARRLAQSGHVGLIDAHHGACGPGPVATGPYRRKSPSGLVGAFKTTSSKAIHLVGHDQFRWQKSFHDSIVRNERSLARITQYIADNPARWSTDSENPESKHVHAPDRCIAAARRRSAPLPRQVMVAFAAAGGLPRPQCARVWRTRPRMV